MNSQNRMNAGAEYVAYRIWATLQGERGIHPESLIACLGALAGYACQVCVRQTAALRGAGGARYALTSFDGNDGTTYFQGDALKGPLVVSPLSVWALVSREVQKHGKPLPDLQEILAHVTQTAGTSAFGVPRVPEGHRPRHLAIVYLKQIWPQILPIAQRFCRKPMHLPVLFGIALQRAIEHTKDELNPTLGASIAMECAVAMSRVALPEVETTTPEITLPAPLGIEVDAAPKGSSAIATFAESTIMRATPARRRRQARDDEASESSIKILVARVPPAARLVTIMALAFITVAGVMREPGRSEGPVTASAERGLASLRLAQNTVATEPPAQDSPGAQDAPEAQDAQPSVAEPLTATTYLPPAMPGDPVEDGLDEPVQAQPPPAADGSDDIVMRE